MHRRSFVARTADAGRAAGFALALLVLPVLFAGALAAQQTGIITGTVTDGGSGAPLSDVQVFLVGREIGAISRANGRYLIASVPAGTYEVRATRIGMSTSTQSATVTAGQTVELNFQLTTQALGLDEIVVTGTAGAARRREVGNSVSQVTLGDAPIPARATTDVLQAAAPGIEITGGSGELGQGKQIRLRGNSSVAMSNQPIIYIDGVRMMDGAFPTVDGRDFPNGRGALVTASPLDNINPNDIERIEVIKGSAATTLYGTEASSGVIQVFTKRGSQGAPVWTAEMQQGTGWVQKFGLNGVDYLHMEHYLRDSWWGGGYEGGEYSVDCVTDPSSRWGSHHSDPKGACSWPGAVWLQQYDLSVRGGAQNLQYFVSGQFQNDVGLMAMDELKKYNFRGNFTMTPLPDLQVQWNTAYSNQWQSNTATANNAQGVTLNAFRQEANYFGTGDPERIAVTLDNDLQNRIERFTTGATVAYSPFASLNNRLTVGYDFSQQEGRNLRNFGYEQFPQGGLTNNTWSKRILTFDYVGTYAFSLTSDLRSSFSWGGQTIGNEEREVEAWGENFPGAAEPTVGSASITVGDEARERVWNAGFFFQNVFDLSNKYFLTLGLRVDGNSAFGSGFGLQSYPKVSASWVVSDESFWSGSWGQLKLRAAYGQSGQAPGAFDAVRTWTPAGYAGDPAFVPANLGNADLGPEVTREIELGFDASWLNDRIGATFTYYDQLTTDALMNVTSVPSEGFTGSQLQNVGEIGNKGIEIDLRAAAVQTAEWGVDLGLAISTNHSKVLDMGGIPEFNDLGGRIIEGYPAPVRVGARVANPDSIGGWRYETADPRAGGINVIIGPGLPTHFVTPSVTVRVPGNVQISARGEYRGGHVISINPMSISRSVRSPLCFPHYVDPAAGITLKADTPALWRERCTPSGGRDYWYDGDYFKLRTLSATVPVGFMFPARVGNATLTATLANFWKWTREIPWFEQEILNNSGANGDGLGTTERVPAPATLRLALRVTF
jgi:TonB-linked SusC/RagA family outer membrane protein